MNGLAEGDVKRFAQILLVLGGLLLGHVPAQAQSYPSKPITIVVAYPAGGATDVITRAVSTRRQY